MNNPVLNISYGSINKNINILYSSSLRLFDIIFNNINSDNDKVNIFFDNDSMNSYYYDIYFSNNFLQHTNETQQKAHAMHLKDIIGIHSPPPNSFKKEDVQLTHNNLQKTHKILFNRQTAESWGFLENDKTSIIEYGIPITNWIHKDNRNKDVLVLNMENNPQVTSLYNHIKNHIPLSDIATAINPNVPIDNIAKFIANYKIVLDFGNEINTLFVASCGTTCLTSLDMGYSNRLIYNISNYSDIINIIKTKLNEELTQQDRQSLSKNITDKYDYDFFKIRLIDKLFYLKNKENFIL